MEDDPVWVDMGRGEPGREVEQEAELPAAIIYLPDPDTRRGWYSRWVMRPKQNKTQKPMGFGPRRGGK